MKKILVFCLVGIAALFFTACDFNPFTTVVVSGSDKTITKDVNNASATYGIIFDGLQFTDSNVTINIEPVADSEKARVEVTYSEGFDNYGFYVTINNGNILVGADSHYQYDIDTFAMTIYAAFDEVDMNGGGYKTLINATGISNLDIDARGAVDCDVSSLASFQLTINTSGSSDFTLSGATTNANIKASGSSDIDAKNLVCGSVNGNATIETSGSSFITTKLASSRVNVKASGSSEFILSGTTIDAEIDTSGSSDIDAKYLTCDSVNIKTSGSSDLVISVRNSLRVDASGASDIEYYGSPTTVTIDTGGASSVRKISSNLPN